MREKTIIAPTHWRHIAIIFMAICLLASCHTPPAYHSYQTIPPTGWDKRDTLFFKVDSITATATYTLTLCVRNNADYPFSNLCLKTKMQEPQRYYKTHLTIQPPSAATGGINYATQEIRLDTVTLTKGSRPIIKIAHHMRGETIKGITDIGIKLTSEP